MFLLSYNGIGCLSSILCNRGYFIYLCGIFGLVSFVCNQIHSEWSWGFIGVEGNPVLCWMHPGRRLREFMGCSDRFM